METIITELRLDNNLSGPSQLLQHILVLLVINQHVYTFVKNSPQGKKTTVAFFTFKDLITGFSSTIYNITLPSMQTEINQKLNSVYC